jgi:small multidrug resistance pump
MMSWVYLMSAILLEICGTTCLKLSQGMTQWKWALGVVGFYSLSFTSLSWALLKLEIGVAYAIWAGLGTALIAVIGIVWFRESVDWVKLVSLAAIIGGVVGLNLRTGGH